jgi:hypothetical protein
MKTVFSVVKHSSEVALSAPFHESPSNEWPVGIKYKRWPMREMYGECKKSTIVPKMLSREPEPTKCVLQVMFPSSCSFIVSVFTVSLYVSAYMAIFKCVGYFIFINLTSLLFSAFFFTWSHSACFHLCFFFSVFLRYFYCFLACMFVCLLGLWTDEEWNGRNLERSAQWGASQLLLFTKCN